jgi:hypothetical protein
MYYHYYAILMWSTIILFPEIKWFSHIVEFTEVLIYQICHTMYQINHTWFYPPPTLSFIPPPAPSWNSFRNFSFTYMCTQYLHYIHLPTLFPCLLPPHNWYQPHPSTQDLFHPSSVFQLWEGKNWHFHSFKISTEGVSLWLSMYICIITQIGSSLFLFFLPLFPS